MAVRIDFWFDFASTYSYLTLQRIAPLADAAGVEAAWRPFLLGPIFAEQGWSTSPFNIYPAKGAFMFRDMARRAEAYGLPFRAEGKLPVNSVSAARLALAALDLSPRTDGPALCRRISFAHWGEGRAIDDPAVLADCARDIGFDPEALAQHSATPALKPRLRESTDDAKRLGVFGAPSFTVGFTAGAAPELFWGDDQLEDALAWAQTGRMAPRRAAR